VWSESQTEAVPGTISVFTNPLCERGYVSDLDRNHPSADTRNVNEQKPALTLPAVVEKIIEPLHRDAPEKAQIAIKGADDL
jgi:hypothetical protein